MDVEEKNRYNKEHYLQNKEKKRQINKEYYLKHKERIQEYRKNRNLPKDYKRKYNLRRLYGITLEAFAVLLEKQNFCCAVCGTDTPKGQWHVDHDHVYGFIRGILCARCNKGLGHFQDDPFVMEKAIAYLERRVVW